MNGQLLRSQEQGSAVDPALIFVASAFQGTPWEAPVQQASVYRPEVARDAYKAVVGLYWAYGHDLPTASQLGAPTKQLLTKLALRQTAAAAEQSEDEDRQRVLNVAWHVRDFVGVWAALQPEEVTIAVRTEALTKAMHTDAAKRFDTRKYNCRPYASSLRSIARLYADGDKTANLRANTVLSRHFTLDSTVPPVAIIDNDLERVLAVMRERYGLICQHPNHEPNIEGGRLLWEVVGANGNSALSLKEALLDTDQGERGVVHQALAQELKIVADSTWLERAERQGRAVHMGSLSLAMDQVSHGNLDDIIIPEVTTGYTPESPWLGPENVILSIETKELVHHALASLATDEQRQCIQLRHIEGCSVQKTAERMGLSIGATKQLQYRATVHLRELLISLQ